MTDVAKVGEPFSRLYLARGTPASDSARFRHRVHALFEKNSDKRHWAFVNTKLELELGVSAGRPIAGNMYYNFDAHFKKSFLSDLLSTLTFVYQAMLRFASDGSSAEYWRAFVERCFREENLCYKTDDRCGVHYLVDEEFETNRSSCLAILEKPRFRAAEQHVRSVMISMDQFPASTRDAIRYAFDAAETTFRVKFPSASRLGSKEVTSLLSPKLPSFYDGAALHAASRMAASFGDWVDGSHQYRHAQGDELPAAPPIDLAVAMISSGLSFVRWLAELDGRSQTVEKAPARARPAR